MSYEYNNNPPTQYYGGPPPQQQYGGQQPYPPQGYPSQQYGPGPYAAPPPPGQHNAPPPGQYGIPPPPSGQYGVPPPQLGQYSTPPPPGQYGVPLQHPPWPIAGPAPSAPQPAAQPLHPITFRFTGQGKDIVNSEVVDQWGRTGWTVLSPSKKETYIKNQGGSIVGRIEWHSSPKIDFLGYQGKSKAFLPRGKDKQRIMRFNKQNYDLVETDGTVRFHPRFEPSASYAILRHQGGRTELEISPSALELGNRFIEHAILVAVLYHSGHSFGDSDGMDVLAGVWGAGAATGLAVSC